MWDLKERMELWIQYNEDNENAKIWISKIKKDIIKLSEGDSQDKEILLGLEGFSLEDQSKCEEREAILQTWFRIPHDQ